MKSNIRDKIKRFIQSEDGYVSAKRPLALGVATGGILLAQAIFSSPTEAYFECESNSDCSTEIGEICKVWYEVNGPGFTIEWHSECVIPDE